MVLGLPAPTVDPELTDMPAKEEKKVVFSRYIKSVVVERHDPELWYKVRPRDLLACTESETHLVPDG